MKRLALVAASIAVVGTAHAQLNNQWVEFVKNPGGISAGTISDTNNETDLAWGDLDQDGWTDVVVVRKQPFTSTGKRTNILLMNENGVLTDRTLAYATDSDAPGGDQGFLTATNDRDVVLADFNQDGWLDVVTATTLSDGNPKYIGHPRIYMNKGKVGGVWQGLKYEEARIPQLFHFGNNTPQNPRFCSVAAGDLTGNGYPDLYFGDYDSSGAGGAQQGSGEDLNDRLLINDGNGFFTDQSQARMTSGMLNSAFGNSVEIEDMNLDGRNDVVKDTALNAPQNVSVIYNSQPSGPGAGTYGQFNLHDIFHTNAPYHTSTGDLNNDGRPDVVVSDDGADRYRYNLSNDALGQVNWSSSKTFAFAAGGDDGFASNNLIADLNNDGWNDVMICDVDVDIGGYNRRLHIYRNPGGAVGSQPTLKEERQSNSGGWMGVVGMFQNDLTGTHDVAAFDVDNDGDNDLLVSRKDGTDLWINQTDPLVWQNLGGGALGSSGVPALAGTGSLAVGTANQLDLTNAAASATALLVASATTINVPLYGGTLVPALDLIVGQTTSGSGSLALPFVMPAGLPSGFSLYIQYWIQDGGALGGYSASNGLQGTTL